jgi:hypothetical protein
MSLENIKEKIKDDFANVIYSDRFRYWMLSSPKHPWTLGGLMTMFDAKRGSVEAARRISMADDLLNLDIPRGLRAIERACTLTPLFAAAGAACLNDAPSSAALLMFVPIVKLGSMAVCIEMEKVCEKAEDWAFHRIYHPAPAPVSQ